MERPKLEIVARTPGLSSSGTAPFVPATTGSGRMTEEIGNADARLQQVDLGQGLNARLSTQPATIGAGGEGAVRRWSLGGP